jgi:HEAT repeat protein
MTVLDLVSRMGTNAWPAWPAVARSLADDDPSVRQMAINFFTRPEDEKAFLNQLPASDKKKLLPSFIRTLEDNGPNWGARNNAALALKYFPEQAPLVAPALTQALLDSSPHVRLMAAEALNRVDAGAAKKAGAVTVVIEITQDPDDQIAWRAVSALRDFQNEPEAVVPALIEALGSTNSLVGCSAVWTIDSSFRKHADRFIPALKKAAERTDNVGGYARGALKGFESSPAAK